MRDRSNWHAAAGAELKPVWPQSSSSFTVGDLLDVELGLYLLETVMPARTAADAWALLGGYPYSEALGDVRTDEARLRIRRARHYLWDRCRRFAWHQALAAYLEIPPHLRGYAMTSIEDTPLRLSPARAADRFARFETLLTSPPDFEKDALPVAGAGEFRFFASSDQHSVVIPEDLLAGQNVTAHDLDASPAGKGRPVEVTWRELESAAAEMDDRERAQPGVKRNDWVKRLARVTLRVRNELQGEFTHSTILKIDRLMHMVGMVGAGKSTIRDILAYLVTSRAQQSLHVTIVVGDVAEMLTVTEQFRVLGVRVAPILGSSTRERNIQRLHRRSAASADSMLAHDHPGFKYLSSACALDALRGLEAKRSLRISDSPCHGLYRGEDLDEADQDRDNPQKRRKKRPKRHACPLWYSCPRHLGARELVDAQIWVATPASLVHSRIPVHLNEPKLRYLELVCRRSDLVIVDEADRVQMQLDTAFAPAATLVAQGVDSWLDEVGRHKLSELARDGRLQLSSQEIDDWNNAVNSVITATDRIYSLLIRDEPLRRWITQDYFSALTLHRWLINSWFPDVVKDPDSLPEPGEGSPERRAAMARVEQILDRFRDQPLQQLAVGGNDSALDDDVNALVAMALELLHAPRGASTRERLKSVLLTLLPDDAKVLDELDTHLARFEFTLVLAALHHRLNHMTILWPRVEAALNLESTSNVLSRRPPKDYMPVVPESPMGNILGFQFQAGDRNADGDQSGELRFFRCNGVGRELLLELCNIPSVDDRPGPNVLLMSATSWAGTSSRYHLHVDVDAVLRPNDDEVEAIKLSRFRKEFQYRPGSNTALRLSGATPKERPQALKQMLHALAVPDRSLAGSKSTLETELADIADPERRRILLLVGSYAEADEAGTYLNSLPEWKGRVTVLVSDDTDLDHSWQTLPGEAAQMYLRRGEVTLFPATTGEILIAPLLAVERGHNIVVAGGKAAIGTAYFLARPHHRPDDIALATQAINDWAVRQVRGPEREFHQLVLAAGSPDNAGLMFRREASKKWNRFLTRRMSWSSLDEDEKVAFTWDQLVVIWQVIGRLVRGGVAARAYFVDGAFSPLEAGFKGVDTPETSLLESMRHVLSPYFSDDSLVSPTDRSLVRALYEPLYNALRDMG